MPDLTLNPAAMTRRLRKAGVAVASTSGAGSGHSLRVFCVTELGARRAAGLLIQQGYDVGRTHAMLTVVIPPTEEERAAAAESDAQQAAAAAELADPTTDAGAALEAAVAVEEAHKARLAAQEALAAAKDSSPLGTDHSALRRRVAAAITVEADARRVLRERTGRPVPEVVAEARAILAKFGDGDATS